jgi:iron complex transport system substrate-binding protein
MRIASLLPSATEIVCALGLADSLVGVSHECDYPPEVVAHLPCLTRSAIPTHLPSAELDTAVSARLKRGESLYLLEEELINDLKPDILITQELCDVCAISFDDVCSLAIRLPNNPRIVSLAPPTIAGVLNDIRIVANALGYPESGEALVAQLQARMDAVTEQVQGKPRPRVFALEWLDPPFAAGHWVPEMIAHAGGEELIGIAGEKSQRITWQQIIAALPEVIFLIPCGYSAEAAEREFADLPKPPGWQSIPAVQQGRIHALNANAYFSRPGPRIIEGIEILASVLHHIAVEPIQIL